MVLSLALVPMLLLAGQDAPALLLDELQTSYNNLKAAEQSKDIDQIKKFAMESSVLARKALKSAKPANIGETDAWEAQVALAKEVEPAADSALYTAAVQARDRVQMMDLFDTLQKQSPDSKYVSQLYGLYLGALAQSGQAAKAYEVASKAIAKDPNNEDLLGVLADGAMTRQQWDRAATYGSKLASVMTGHPKPEGVAAADWERRRGALIGRGHWIAGMSYSALGRWSQADKSLKAALPGIKGENQLMAGALFNLGLANYNLARATQDKVLMKQALGYSEEAFKLGGPYSQPANQNVYAIKQELAKMR